MTNEEWQQVRELRNKFTPGSDYRKFLERLFNYGPNWNLDAYQTEKLTAIINLKKKK